MLSRVWSAVAAACLIGCGSAAAQSVGDARIRAAYTDWRRLSQTEVDCAQQALRAQRTQLQDVIQRGIGPNDAAMASIRAACRMQTRAGGQPTPALGATQALASVDTETTRRAAERLAAEKAAEKALAEKIAAERAAAAKAAEDKAAADKVAAEKAAAQKAAEQKAATDKITAEKMAAAKAAADKEAADRAARDEAAARMALAEKAAVTAAKKDAERPATDMVQPPSEDEHPPQDAAQPPPEPAYAQSVWESRISFVYGLMIGPVIFCFGGVVFLMIGQPRGIAATRFRAAEQSEAAASGDATRTDRAEFERLVASVLVELNRRKGRPTDPAAREPRAEEAALH